MDVTIKSFQHWLYEEGRSVKTIESYGGDIKGFQQFLHEKAVNEQQPLSRFSFVRYKEHLQKAGYATVNHMNTITYFRSITLKIRPR